MTPTQGYARPGLGTSGLVQFNQQKFPDVAKKTHKKRAEKSRLFFIVLLSVVQIVRLR
jgi:hypothetical protein